jgi:cardiolipin synthase
MTLPNFITILRLLTVPLIIMMIAQKRWDVAFALFVLAGLSDAVDGFIARHYHMKSVLGAYLDAIADKALLVSMYVALAMVGILPIWLAILVVSRDLMIVAGVILAWGLMHPITIRPLLVSKINTGFQIGFVAVLLGAKAFNIPLGMWENVAEWGVASLTLASMGAYLLIWVRHMADHDHF